MVPGWLRSSQLPSGMGSTQHRKALAIPQCYTQKKKKRKIEGNRSLKIKIKTVKILEAPNQRGNNPLGKVRLTVATELPTGKKTCDEE